MLILPRSCVAVCGHHLSPRIGVILSLLSSAPNFSMAQTTTLYIPGAASATPMMLLPLLYQAAEGKTKRWIAPATTPRLLLVP